jgi:hypothetical protein
VQRRELELLRRDETFKNPRGYSVDEF